jgi:FKBP-type peptidyl-prolyl cis-trans isomerase
MARGSQNSKKPNRIDVELNHDAIDLQNSPFETCSDVETEVRRCSSDITRENSDLGVFQIQSGGEYGSFTEPSSTGTSNAAVVDELNLSPTGDLGTSLTASSLNSVLSNPFFESNDGATTEWESTLPPKELILSPEESGVLNSPDHESSNPPEETIATNDRTAYLDQLSSQEFNVDKIQPPKRVHNDPIYQNAPSSTASSREPMEVSLDTKSALDDGQRVAYCALAYLEIQHAYDYFDLEYKSTHVALQAYGSWAQKIMLRVYQHLGIDDQERKMIENLVKHGVTSQDLVSALIPVEAMEQHKLEQKRKQEEILRQEEQEIRRQQRLKEEEERKLEKEKKRQQSTSNGSSEKAETNRPNVLKKKRKKKKKKKAQTLPSLFPSKSPAQNEGDGHISDALTSGSEYFDSSEDEVVPLPEYDALPGDNYFPNQPGFGEPEDFEGATSDEEVEGSKPGHSRSTSHRSNRDSISGQEVRSRTSSVNSLSSVTKRSRNSTQNSIPLPNDLERSDQGECSSRLEETDVRHTVLADLFLLCISEYKYDARARSLVHRVAHDLLVTEEDISDLEHAFAQQLDFLEGVHGASGKDLGKDFKARSKRDRGKRYAAMVAAAMGGGLVLGLSAGFAAPLIGAGLGAAFTGVGITGTTAFLSGTGGVALITTGATLTGSGTSIRPSWINSKVLFDNANF